MKMIIGIVLLVCIAALAFALQKNKELIQVGSGYAAKTVCTNLFYAQRDPKAVMRDDVQAQGHPILKLLKIKSDEQVKSVDVSLFGLGWAGATATGNANGCSLLHASKTTGPDNAIKVAGPDQSPVVNSEAASTLPWPEGSGVTPSENGELDTLMQTAMQELGTRAVVVVHKGRIVTEAYAEGFTVKTPMIGWSLAKSVSSILTGMAVDDGLVSPDDDNLFEEWENDDRSAITLENLLHMESGLAFNESYGAVSDVTRMLFLENDMAGFTRNMGLDVAPGSRFEYASGTTNLITSLLARRLNSPQSSMRYPYERLFEPLGMQTAFFETDASQNFVGSSYIYASARDWARLGQFLLQRGQWNDEQLLAASWIDFMTTPSPRSEGEYGAHLWLRGEGGDDGFELPDDAFWLLGHDSQSVAILPSHELVVVRLGMTPDGNGFKPQRLVEGIIQSDWMKTNRSSKSVRLSAGSD